SRALSGEIVRRLGASQADLEVTYLDLAAEPLPHYSAASLAAGGGAEGARDAALLTGFLDADVIVIGAPLYNFGLPSQLKAWVDRIVIQGKTFRYTAQGPQGLAGGKRVIVAIARGGVYAPGAGTEFAESYLKFVFSFLGITDLTFVRAEGLNISPESREQSLQGARASIQGLSPAVAATLAA
ncbi:MAG TPA: NAD(P)H-dependent oxidoreductase, partial [Steroidobacteraceae bacterium]